jgi:hypothetical protein
MMRAVREMLYPVRSENGTGPEHRPENIPKGTCPLLERENALNESPRIARPPAGAAS